MKWITIGLTMLSLNLFGQDKSDSTLFLYRIGIKDVTTTGSANLIKDPLTDLFKTKPFYEESLGTFLFQSKEDIEQTDLYKILATTSFNEVISFKKEKLIK